MITHVQIVSDKEFDFLTMESYPVAFQVVDLLAQYAKRGRREAELCAAVHTFSFEDDRVVGVYTNGRRFSGDELIPWLNDRLVPEWPSALVTRDGQRFRMLHPRGERLLDNTKLQLVARTENLCKDECESLLVSRPIPPAKPVVWYP